MPRGLLIPPFTVLLPIQRKEITEPVQMAWHMGHPLSQTLFTSIYLDKLLWPIPKSFDEYDFHRGDAQERTENEQRMPLVHLVLRAYCLGLTKACDLVHQRITQEYYYEVGSNVFVS